MNSMQDIMDAIGKAGKNTRSDYHLTLGKLIEFLKNCDGDMEVKTSDGTCVDYPHSYRGYYSDLSLEPTDKKITVSSLLKEITEVLDTTKQGYKGGDFFMDKDVPLWVANYGDCGKAIMNIAKNDNLVVLMIKEVD